MSRRDKVTVGAAYAAAWAGLAVVIGLVVFLTGSRTVSLASHDAEVSPDLTGQAVLHTGPVLPDLRVDSGSAIGLDIRLGKTDAVSTEALVERYALIASQPQGPADRLHDAVVAMALGATVKGGALALVPVLLWVMVGPARRRELASRTLSRQGAFVGLVVVLVGVAVWAPWEPDEETVDEERGWIALQDFLGPSLPLPQEAQGVEVQDSATTAQTRRLIESAVDTYRTSVRFYADLEEQAAELELRRPADDETAVLLVSDRHDNIGMDAVARAVADRAGVTAVFDAGDDTSTGSKWEAFSLDSLTAAFDDLDDRWAVTGNHDQGSFVAGYLEDRGWRLLDGEVVDGPGGSRLLGVGDPRSSGLGSWRDETGLSFEEIGSRLAEVACEAEEAGERVTTILVHDANLADEALARGCTDLVLAGHLHTQGGPTPVTGANGELGYSFTTGTTGGAAYAIALGSKLRRPAQVTVITYGADGRPVGLQPVVVETNGRFAVGEFVPLTYERPLSP